MIAVLILVLSMLAPAGAHSQQFYDINPGKLTAFEFKFNACTATCQKYGNQYFCSSSLKGALHLTLESGASLVLRSDYFEQSGSGASKNEACADANRGFFGDETIRKYIANLEAIRTSSPSFEDIGHGRYRCVIPAIRVFRAPGQSPIDASEIEWRAIPAACPAN